MFPDACPLHTNTEAVSLSCMSSSLIYQNMQGGDAPIDAQLQQK